MAKDAKGHGSEKRGGAAERSARQAKRFPVAPHAGVRSMATHAGYQVAKLNERTNSLEIVAGGRRRAVAENVARGIRADGGFGRVSFGRDSKGHGHG